MSRISDEQINKQLEKIPNEIRDLFSYKNSENVPVLIETFAKKYQLKDSEKKVFADELGLVLLGFTKPGDFTLELKNRLSVPESIASQLSGEVDGAIFSKVRVLLEKQFSIVEPLLAHMPEKIPEARRPTKPEAKKEFPGEFAIPIRTKEEGLRTPQRNEDIFQTPKQPMEPKSVFEEKLQDFYRTQPKPVESPSPVPEEKNLSETYEILDKKALDHDSEIKPDTNDRYREPIDL